MMTEAELLSVLREFLWAGVWIASPLLLTALIVGVCIGLIQALTSIQELTLTFVPKLIAMLVAFVLCSGFAARLMVGLFDDRIIPLIEAGR